MKQLFKKTLSVLMCIIMIISCSPLAFAKTITDKSNEEKYVKPNFSFNLTSDKQKYDVGENIIIKLNVNNNENVTRSAVFELKCTPTIKLSKKTACINNLNAKNSTEYTFSVTQRENNSKFEQFFGSSIAFIFKLISIFNPNYQCVTFYINNTSGAILCCISDEQVNENELEKSISIKTDIFVKDTETDIYKLYNSEAVFSGSLTNAKEVENITIVVTDKNNVQLDSEVIDSPAQLWETNKLGFIIGKNFVTATAKYKDGTIVSDSIEFDCYTDAGLSNLEIDTETDTDNDGLSDYLENYCGSDINNSDTDGDGLTDYQEEVILIYSAINSDSDGDGVCDYDEDNDTDGISDGEEFSIGTDPVGVDSDGDLLDDYQEYVVYKTNPLEKDTDGDDADDMTEITMGTDPLVYNSTINANASCGSLDEGNNVAASVELEVSGEQAKTLKVTEVSVSDNSFISHSIPGYLGSAYDFSVDGTFDEATLTFEYDTSLGTIGDDFQPRIYYFNEDTQLLEELPDQIVENGKVTAKTTHFSTYILLNKVDFDTVWETEIKTPDDQDSQKTGLDIVFVIDSSGSMSSNDGKKLRHQAAKNFVDKLGENDRAAVVDFDSSASVYQNFTSDHTALYNAINRVNSSGGTSLSAGISKAISLFTASSYTRTDAYKYIVFLTDGNGSYSTSYTTIAANNDITIFTVGLGSGVKRSVLEAIANGTNGKYYFASSASNLPDIYNEISFETVDYVTDSNNDGISDYYTKLIYEGKLVCGNGSCEFMGYDFNCDENGNPSVDYDNDGIENGDELVVSNIGGRIYMQIVSDPTEADSDFDGIADYVEITDGSDPLAHSVSSNDVSYLTNNSYYYYVDCVYSEDDIWNTGTRAAWKAITFDWSQKEEAKDMLVSVMSKFNTEEVISNSVDELIQEMIDDLSSQMTDKVIDFAKENITGENVDTGINVYKTGAKAIKAWKTSAKSMKNLNTSTLGNITGTLKLTLRKIGINKLDIKVGATDIIFSILEEGKDLYEISKSYSAIEATKAQFSLNEDILTHIIQSDGKDYSKGYARNAASDLRSYIYEEENIFYDRIGDTALTTVENLADFGLGLLASANPAVLAVTALVTAIDIILPVSAIADAVYHMYTLLHLSEAAISLLSIKYGSVYCTPSENDMRLLKVLAESRKYGETFAAEYIKDVQLIGVSKEEEKQMEQEARDTVVYVGTVCSNLGI